MKTITMFGDSITHMSYYSDAFMRMMYDNFPGKVTILNKGIGGNRIISDASYQANVPGNGASAGRAGRDRYEKSVFGTENPDLIVALEGINDLMHPYLFNRINELPTTEELIAEYKKFIQIAHGHNSKIILGTILPTCSKDFVVGEAGNKSRHEINEWIRTAGKNTKTSDEINANCDSKENCKPINIDACMADAFADFDRVMSQEQNRELLKEGKHFDGLHPNVEGGQIMADELIKVVKIIIDN